MAIKISFEGKYVYFGPESGLHTQGESWAETYELVGARYYGKHDLSQLIWYVRATHPDYQTIINKQIDVLIDQTDDNQIIILRCFLVQDGCSLDEKSCLVSWK